MKKAFALTGLAALALVAAPANAQSAKVGGDIQVWYNQVMDSNLRNNSAASTSYYNLRSEFKEDGFSIRRAEIKVYGSIVDGVEYETMLDPSIATSSQSKTNSSYNPMVLQDAFITWKPMSAFAVRAGQMKTLQTYEGNISSTELLFAERSQLGRVFGDKRDRGAYAWYGVGDPKEVQGKLTLGVFNGMSDLASGKANDSNAQKDFVLRADFVVAGVHKFGAYTLQGATDQADKGALTAMSGWTGTNVPSSTDILDNKDKTTNYGAYYVFQQGPWHFDAEVITGLLGRRYATVYTAASGLTSQTAVLRQHLDQKFFGYYLTAAYTLGNHSFLVRWDSMNYNQGDKWYATTNPYIQTVNGSSCDFSPKYTEATLGYTYAWKPALVKAANFKLNYIIRSKNFLNPVGSQTGEQGGDNVVAALQVAF